VGQEPKVHFRLAVGPAVVGDQMNSEMQIHGTSDLVQERGEFLLPVRRSSVVNRFTGGHIQCGRARGRAVRLAGTGLSFRRT